MYTSLSALFLQSIDLLHYFWVSPLSIAVMMYLMYRQVGVICFWSLAVIVVIISAQAGLSTVFGKLRYIADDNCLIIDDTVVSVY